jgi:hypothetical protein
MDIQREIAEQVKQLPPPMQEQVLRFVTSLNAVSPLVGEKGSNLRQFANSIDPLSAKQMRDAIERDCEQIDSSQW